jgi:hypothetical protein
MKRFLSFTEFFCGATARNRVIEPLLADWQKELGLARSQGVISYATAAVSGAVALMRSLVACAIVEGVWLPPARGMLFSVLAIVFSVAMSIAILLMPRLPSGMTHSPGDPRTQLWLLVMIPTVWPPAFLLAMFMHRRDSRATFRHAIVGVLFAAIATTAVVVATTPENINRRYNTFEFQERIRARMLIAAKSDPDIYRGRAREQTLATSVEQRRANYEKFQSRIAALRKNDPPPTPAERFAQIQPILLSIVFAAMGWMLAGIGHATVSRGVIWWALVLLATITMTPLLSLLAGVPMPQPAQWWMLPMFTSMTLALMAARKTRWSQIRGDS